MRKGLNDKRRLGEKRGKIVASRFIKRKKREKEKKKGGMKEGRKKRLSTRRGVDLSQSSGS